MNELLKRSVTGVVYIFLLLVGIMLNAQAFSFLFLVFGLICMYEFKRLIRLSNYRIYIVFLLMWWLFIYVPINNFLRYLFLFSVLITNVYLIFYLYKKEKSSFSEKEKFLISLLYIGGGSVFIPMIYQSEALIYASNTDFLFPSEITLNEPQHTMIAILCIIWASDSFAYVSGMLFGKRKLFPSVSPKKTIEGFIGGFIGAILIALAFSVYSAKNQLIWVILAVVLVVMGTLGDLVESKFKREAGKKDSGTILPGHGGLLDRLDSLVFASPFAFLVLQLLTYLLSIADFL